MILLLKTNLFRISKSQTGRNTKHKYHKLYQKWNSFRIMQGETEENYLCAKEMHTCFLTYILCPDIFPKSLYSIKEFLASSSSVEPDLFTSI